jgi:hypothetical protein
MQDRMARAQHCCHNIVDGRRIANLLLSLPRDVHRMQESAVVTTRLGMHQKLVLPSLRYVILGRLLIFDLLAES